MLATIQYAQPVTKRGVKRDAAEVTEEKKLSNHAQRELEEKKKGENYHTLCGRDGALTRNYRRCED